MSASSVAVLATTIWRGHGMPDSLFFVSNFYARTFTERLPGPGTGARHTLDMAPPACAFPGVNG